MGKRNDRHQFRIIEHVTEGGPSPEEFIKDKLSEVLEDMLHDHIKKYPCWAPSNRVSIS